MTHKQKLKFVDAVECQFDGNIRSVKLTEDFGRVLIRHLKRSRNLNIYTFFDGKQRAPHIVNGKLRTIPETELNPANLIQDFVDVSEANRRLCMRHVGLIAKTTGTSSLIVHKAIRFRSKPMCMDGEQLAKQCLAKPLVGTIGFIQEKGAKLRSVANPFRLLQCAVRPLGDYLYSLLKELPWDCTYNQADGALFAQSALRERKTIYAYDLSNATDKLPLDIQTNLIRSLLNQLTTVPFYKGECVNESNQATTEVDLIKNGLLLMQEISRANWSSPSLNGYTNEHGVLSWLTGQPQGLYPSFAMFAVTHGFILREIERDLDLNDTFRIVGDDVVITDPNVAASYKIRMMELGVEISAPKTIVSNQLSEFVGFVITPDRISDSFKWQAYKTSNPLGPIKSLGMKGMKFIPFKARRFVKTIVSLPYPIGLGLNPSGIPLITRVAPVWKLYEPIAHDRLTENSYSKADVYKSTVEFWTNVVIPEDPKHYMFRVQEQTCKPYLDESLRTNHDIHVEHYNSATKNVTVNDRLDLSRLSVPSLSDIRPHRGSFKKDDFVLSNLRKAYNAIRDYNE